MARPKLNGPTKQNLTLTVNAETRAKLSALSEHYNMSISSLVEKWAEDGVKELGLKGKGAGAVKKQQE